MDIALYAGLENKNYFKHYGIDEKRLVFMPHAIDHTLISIETKGFRKIQYSFFAFSKPIGYAFSICNV